MYVFKIDKKGLLGNQTGDELDMSAESKNWKYLIKKLEVCLIEDQLNLWAKTWFLVKMNTVQL